MRRWLDPQVRRAKRNAGEAAGLSGQRPVQHPLSLCLSLEPRTSRPHLLRAALSVWKGRPLSLLLSPPPDRQPCPQGASSPAGPPCEEGSRSGRRREARTPARLSSARTGFGVAAAAAGGGATSSWEASVFSPQKRGEQGLPLCGAEGSWGRAQGNTGYACPHKDWDQHASACVEGAPSAARSSPEADLPRRRHMLQSTLQPLRK